MGSLQSSEEQNAIQGQPIDVVALKIYSTSFYIRAYFAKETPKPKA